MTGFANAANKAIVLISLLPPLLSPAGAQSDSNQDNSPPLPDSMSSSIFVTVLIIALLVMGIFSIYVRRRSRQVTTGSGRTVADLREPRRLRASAAAKGLDPAVIETFPILQYSAVKRHKVGEGTLECAVCLTQFEDDDNLRLIPKCDHVFHPECIDVWLELHVTCPVCRANLVPQPGETAQIPEFPNTAEFTQKENDLVLVVEDQDQEGPWLPPQVSGLGRSLSLKPNWLPRSGSFQPIPAGKIPKSYSTGRSLVQPGENTDRFTLRLPEDVRKQVMRGRKVDRTISSVVELPREGSSKRGYRPGVGWGTWGGGSFGRRGELDRDNSRPDRGVRTAVKFSSFKHLGSKDDGTGIVLTDSDELDQDDSRPDYGSRTTVKKFPSFKCLEPKDDETGLITVGSDRPPV